MSSITIASLPRITRESLSNLILSSRSPSTPLASSKLAIIDVRDSDYIGGHIRGCTNIPSSTLDYRTAEMVRTLKDKDVVVFHCALSQQRGPSAALRYVRERKRLLGIDLEDKDAGKTGEGAEKEGAGGSRQKVYVLEGGFTKWQEKWVD